MTLRLSREEQDSQVRPPQWSFLLFAEVHNAANAASRRKFGSRELYRLLRRISEKDGLVKE